MRLAAILGVIIFGGLAYLLLKMDISDYKKVEAGEQLMYPAWSGYTASFMFLIITILCIIYALGLWDAFVEWGQFVKPSQPFQGNFRDSILQGESIALPFIFHTLFKIHLSTPQTVNSLSGDISIILYFGLAGIYQIGPGSMRTRFSVNGNNPARSISSGSTGKTKRRRKYSNKPEE
ncbi:hypothetical protein [Alistipes sp.]|uniref:hypothetical protein n=1 Tax=Alistipes sp. TaxID=1872444 RepID=UPI003AB4AD9D